MQHVCSPRLCFHVNQDCNLILFFTNINLRQDHAVKLGKLSSLWVRKNSNIPPAIQPTYSAGESIENSSFDLKGCASQQIYTKVIYFLWIDWVWTSNMCNYELVDCRTKVDTKLL